jgi:hypothetical protein
MWISPADEDGRTPEIEIDEANRTIIFFLAFHP